MPFQIRAILDQATLVGLFHELTPVVVSLGEGSNPHRWIRIERPSRMTLEEGVGLHVETTARASWTVAGVSVEFALQRLELLLRPVLDPALGRINLAATVEQIDLRNIPTFIDDTFMTRINEWLERTPDALGWTFSQTLSASFKIPHAVFPLETFDVAPGNASLELGSSHWAIALELAIRFTRSLEGLPLNDTTAHVSDDQEPV